MASDPDMVFAQKARILIQVISGESMKELKHPVSFCFLITKTLTYKIRKTSQSDFESYISPSKLQDLTFRMLYPPFAPIFVAAKPQISALIDRTDLLSTNLCTAAVAPWVACRTFYWCMSLLNTSTIVELQETLKEARAVK